MIAPYRRHRCAMKVSRRRFLECSIKGLTLVSGLSFPQIAKSAGDEENAKGTTGSAVAPPGTEVPPATNESKLNNSPAELAQPEPPKVLTLPKIQGEIIVPDSASYDESRKNYNGRYDVKPKYILYCQNENDVVQAVKWAQAEKLKVSIRSGGHSYEAFSLIQDGVVIDVSKMTNVKVDPSRKFATVETGITLMPLYEALWQKRVIVPGGSCASVGIAGVTLGGGFGLLSRHMGLTCDNLQALRMVNAKGELVIADAKNHSDLLWACRGGGAGNFGVATQFTFKLHPIGNVTIIKLRWNWQDMKAVIQAWQQWAPNTDERLSSVLTMSSKSAGSLLFLGMFIGPPSQANALIQPLLSAAKPIKDSVETSPFIEAARRFSGFKRPVTPLNSKALPDTTHMHVHPRFKNTSDYVNADLSEDAIDTIIKYLTDCPIKSSCVQFDGYGGAITRIPVQDTAFCHRAGTKFCMHYQSSWGGAAHDAEGIAWVESFRQAMQPFVSGFSYANYCDLSIEDWAHRYYGDNLARLSEIKSKYDPDGFFSYPQSIRGTSA